MKREMLTKSDLLSFRRCPRKLWLEQHGPKQNIIATPDRRMQEGTEVGAKARERLGTDILCPESSFEDQAAAVKAEKELLAKFPGRTAVDVHMAHGGLYARADALIPKGKKYILQETKSSSFPLKKDGTPDTPDKRHLDDVAIQAWIMKGSKIPISHAKLNFIDGRWPYPGGGDYADLFRQMDVTAKIKDRISQVPAWLEQAKKTLSGNIVPNADTGAQCSTPYACPFQGFCAKRKPPGPEHPLELLPNNAGKALAEKLRKDKGYESILDPKPHEFTGKEADLYRRMQKAHRTGKSVLAAGSGKEMKVHRYPRYFFDFEGINLAVPRWAGVKPNEQITFQWSCHIERAPGNFEHVEFLDLTGNDPSLPCIEKIIAAINRKDGGPIFVYHATYERGRLEELAERHPRHAPVLKSYLKRLVDLLPVVRKYYYHPDMRGSFSIKKVLKVIAPDLNHAHLDEVQDGTAAQIAYVEAANPKTSPERKAEIDENLRMYCRQDTWAMVEIAYFLESRGKRRPKRPSEGGSCH